MKRSAIAGTALGVGITAAIVTGALAAQAHDAAIQANCAGASIHLSNYPNHSSLTGTVDGAPVEVIFNGSYSDSIQWDATKNHSYDITVISGDGDHRYDKHYSQEVTGCAPTETPTPTSTSTSTPQPSSTPSVPSGPPTPTGSPSPSDEPSSTTPPASPSPSGTPSPVTVHPAPTASPTPAPTTPPRSTVPKTEAPVPTAVKAPATFTG